MRFVQRSCAGERLMSTGVEGRLILGDGTRPPEEYRDRVQCVYLDPPFNTGEKFIYRARWGEKGWADGTQTLTLDAYTDRFSSREAYHALLRSLLQGSRELLTDSGSLFLHVDPREAARARLICDEVFGENNFVNEIIWAYQTGGRALRTFSRKHDNILFYRKTKAQYFDISAVGIPRAGNRQNHMKRQVDAHGRVFRTISSGGKVYTYYDDDPVYPGDVWTDVSHMQQKDPQRTGYDTQKPLSLLRRIVDCSTRPGDLVADLCCGSGTALVAAARGGRRFLGMDLAPTAIVAAQKRLTDTALTVDKPFDAPDAALEAQVEPGIGFDEIRLTGYASPELEAQGISGLDAVDGWAVGFLEGDVFLAYDLFTRSKPEPALKNVLLLPQLRGQTALAVTDALGRSSLWVREEEA